MSARTGDPRKTLVPKTIMAVSTNEVMLDDAGRNQISVSGVSGLAPSQVGGEGKVGPLWQIQQASEKFEGGHC